MVLQRSSGARSVFFATVANTVDAPVTLDIATERATLSLRGDLTVRHADGRSEVIRERVAASSGRAYWGVSHEVLIRDFYSRLGDDPEPFWISPREAVRSLAVIEQVYAQSALRDAPHAPLPPPVQRGRGGACGASGPTAHLRHLRYLRRRRPQKMGKLPHVRPPPLEPR